MRLFRSVTMLTGLLALLWTLSDELPPALQLSAQAAEGSSSAFLIRFGAGDQQGRGWDGRLTVQNGTIRKLHPWQFAERDEITARDGWRCSTRVETYWFAPWERNLHPTKRHNKLTQKGVLAVLDMFGPGSVEVETRQGAFSFAPDEVTWASPKSFLGGSVVVSRSPEPQRVTTGSAAEDYVSTLEANDGSRWTAYQTYDSGGDRLWVRKNRDEPIALSSEGLDLFGTAIAEDGQGRIWVIWAAQESGNWDLYARSLDDGKWSLTQRLTGAPGADIFHAVTRDGQGRLYLVWQSSRAGNSDIYLRILEGKNWQPEIQVSDDPASDWEPDVTASEDGQVTIVWDTYSKGNYDVVMRQFRNGELLPMTTVADSPSLEARATAHYDPSGRLWLAWDEGDPDWGKDYVLGVENAGMGLLMRRQVRVATYENGRLKELPGDLRNALPEEESQIFHGAQLASDGNGNLWVLFRYRTNTPVVQAQSRFRSMWRLGSSSYQNGAWTPLIEFPAAFGRIDSPFAAYTDRHGDLQVVWVSDGRRFPDGFQRDQDIFAASLEAGAQPGQPTALVDFRPSTDRSAGVHPTESTDVERLRDYRARAAGKTYRIVRGDMHRHTDISWDGNRDGSLVDAYRYAIDAAAMDYLGVADHQAGQEVEYSWWMIQKAVDLFTIPGRFAPLYGYERSRSYPSGHRNAMFAQRGVRVLNITAEERENSDQVSVGHFYENLRENRGIVMIHTSATGAGTDWRDNDPEVETLVELYQGYRRNYEHEGAPRSGSPSSHPAGYVWKAWEKGLKLGVQASSDHVSTHASYAMVYTEELHQEAIIEGIRHRRAYAATDNILVDMRVNGHLMGAVFETDQAPTLTATIAGTGPIAKVEVIRNNQYAHTQAGSGAELEFTYRDNAPLEGESYYYIRVEQENGEVAWSSPVWVTYKK